MPGMLQSMFASTIRQQQIPTVSTDTSLYMDGINDIVDTPNSYSTSNQRLVHPNANQRFTIAFLCNFQTVQAGQWNIIYRYNFNQFVTTRGFEIGIRRGTTHNQIAMVWGGAFDRFTTSMPSEQSVISNDIVEIDKNYWVVITMPNQNTFGSIWINGVDETNTHINGSKISPDGFNNASRYGIGCHPNFGTSATHYGGYRQPEWYISYLTSYWGWIGQNNLDYLNDLIVNQGIFPDLLNPDFYETFPDDAPTVWSRPNNQQGITQKPVPMVFMPMQVDMVDSNGWLNTPRLNNGAAIVSQNLMP